MSSEGVTLVERGILQDVNHQITSLCCPTGAANILLSGGRNKKAMLWRLFDAADENGLMGKPLKALEGHDGPVNDVVMSSDNQFGLTASSDSTLRLWDLNYAKTVRPFKGHVKDVFSVTFSQDNRQIVSAGRDMKIKLWNTLATCKHTIGKGGHSDWVTCVRFTPSTKSPNIVSGSVDRTVKVWTLEECRREYSLEGHMGYINSVTVSPDGSLCASGGLDAKVNLWDVNHGTHLYQLETDSEVYSLCFSPSNYWLAAATHNGVKLWDLETKKMIAEITPPESKKKLNPYPWVRCLAWSADGQVLYAGTTNGRIHCYQAV